VPEDTNVMSRRGLAVGSRVVKETAEDAKATAVWWVEAASFVFLSEEDEHGVGQIKSEPDTAGVIAVSSESSDPIETECAVLDGMTSGRPAAISRGLATSSCILRWRKEKT